MTNFLIKYYSLWQYMLHPNWDSEDKFSMALHKVDMQIHDVFQNLIVTDLCVL